MLWTLLVGVVLALCFLSMPDLDPFVSHLFFTVDDGFLYAHHPIVLGIYAGVKVISATVILATSGLFFWRWRFQEKPLPMVKKTAPAMRVSLFLLLAFLLGPGAAVHWGGKMIFERPRPRQVIEFGGQLPYKPPFALHDSSWKRERGYSFPSGHSSVGFFLTAFGLVATTRRKRITFYSLGIVAGLIVGAGRILQGGHFLSDVLFAGVLICLVNHSLYWWMFERKKARPEAIG